MRRFLMTLPSCFLFLLFLLRPETVVSGASEGLLLWFRTVLPTLFPFLVITSLLTGTNAFSFFSSVFYPLFGKLFRVSKPAVIVVIGGFFCGYPMGAKMVSDLWKTKQISRKEGLYLLSFCNNASPMFIISFFVMQKLQRPELVLPSVSILFLSPLLCSFLFRKFYFEETAVPVLTPANSKPASGFLEVFDDAINNGMETMVKIGGYIMFFSVLIQFLRHLPTEHAFLTYVLTPSLEITGGITLLSSAALPPVPKYMLMMSQLSFGGFCAVFQTKCVLKGQDFPLGIYVIEKLVTAIVTSLLVLLYLVLTKFCF